MKTAEGIIAGIILLIIILLVMGSCDKTDRTALADKGFVLSSSAIGSDSLLPSKYTCDGESSSPPLTWKGAPEGTASYALIMDHIASPTDIHWYWILYNIPTDICSLAENATGIGIQGTNSVNDQTRYAPPCSQGPGIKAYTLTLYALSQAPAITVPPDSVTRAVLLEAIKDITMSEAKLTVYYSRDVK